MPDKKENETRVTFGTNNRFSEAMVVGPELALQTFNCIPQQPSYSNNSGLSKS